MKHVSKIFLCAALGLAVSASAVDKKKIDFFRVEHLYLRAIGQQDDYLEYN